MTPLVLRTVYDARPRKPALRHLCLALLNAITWSAYARDVPLEIIVVGQANPDLLEVFAKLGARVQPRVPHPQHQDSPTYNKLLALPREENEPRVLMIDNDTVLLGSLAPLAEKDPSLCMASVADKGRVPEGIWIEVLQALEQNAIEQEWVPWHERWLAKKEGREPKVLKRLYFNSGVVLVPAGAAGLDFSRRWNRAAHRLGKLCRERNWEQRALFGSDQLALAMAVGVYGKFEHLPIEYHYRAFNFWSGALPGEQIRLVHMFGSHPVFKPLPREEKWNLEAFVDAYWAAMPGKEPPPEGPASGAAELVRKRVVDAIRAGGIADVKRFWPRSAE